MAYKSWNKTPGPTRAMTLQKSKPCIGTTGGGDQCNNTIRFDPSDKVAMKRWNSGRCGKCKGPEQVSSEASTTHAAAALRDALGWSRNEALDEIAQIYPKEVTVEAAFENIEAHAWARQDHKFREAVRNDYGDAKPPALTSEEVEMFRSVADWRYSENDEHVQDFMDRFDLTGAAFADRRQTPLSKIIQEVRTPDVLRGAMNHTNYSYYREEILDQILHLTQAYYHDTDQYSAAYDRLVTDIAESHPDSTKIADKALQAGSDRSAVFTALLKGAREASQIDSNVATWLASQSDCSTDWMELAAWHPGVHDDVHNNPSSGDSARAVADIVEGHFGKKTKYKESVVCSRYTQNGKKCNNKGKNMRDIDWCGRCAGDVNPRDSLPSEWVRDSGLPDDYIPLSDNLLEAFRRNVLRDTMGDMSPIEPELRANLREALFKSQEDKAVTQRAEFVSRAELSCEIDAAHFGDIIEKARPFLRKPNQQLSYSRQDGIFLFPSGNEDENRIVVLSGRNDIALAQYGNTLEGELLHSACLTEDMADRVANTETNAEITAIHQTSDGRTLTDFQQEGLNWRNRDRHALAARNISAQFSHPLEDIEMRSKYYVPFEKGTGQLLSPTNGAVISFDKQALEGIDSDLRKLAEDSTYSAYVEVRISDNGDTTCDVVEASAQHGPPEIISRLNSFRSAATHEFNMDDPFSPDQDYDKVYITSGQWATLRESGHLDESASLGVAVAPHRPTSTPSRRLKDEMHILVSSENGDVSFLPPTLVGPERV